MNETYKKSDEHYLCTTFDGVFSIEEAVILHLNAQTPHESRQQINVTSNTGPTQPSIPPG